MRFYRFSFNGKEKDDEVKGTGNQIDYGMRAYDPRLGRFMSVDPLTKKYSWYTPYQFAGNKPISFIDLDGLEEAKPKTNTVIDAGHGGDDPGTPKQCDSRNEADVTLKVATFAEKKLNQLGAEDVNITMTRTTDVNPGGNGQKASLNARVKISKNAGADAFVSIHVDAANNKNADKVTVFRKINSNVISKQLTKNIALQLKQVVVSNQGIEEKEGNHQVTREQNSSTAASLVEIGYMTNESQENLFQNDNYLRQVGDAIGIGIYNTLYPQKSPPPIDDSIGGSPQK